MKKLIIIPFLFFTLFTILFAQTIDLNWASDFKVERLLFSQYQPLHLSDDAYYVLSSSRKEASIIKFDLAHKYISHTKILDDLNGLSVVPQSVLMTKRNVFAYTTKFNRKSKRMYLYASKLKEENFEPLEEIYQYDYSTGGPLKVGALALAASESITKKGIFSDLVDLEISPDSTQVALVDTSPFQKLNENKEIDIAVFDEELNVLWERKIELDVKLARLLRIQKAVANDGSIYVLVDILRKNKEREKNSAPSESRLYRVTPDEVQEIPLGLDNESFITDARIFISNETGQVSIAGFYASKLIGRGLQGIFHLGGNAKDGFGPISFQKFDKELLAFFNSDRALKKGAGLPNTFRINNTVSHVNGDISLVAEIDFVQEDGDDECPEDEYHSYDIIVPRISAGGSLLSLAHIQKSFVSDKDASPNSYAMTSDQDNIYLLFNYSKTKFDFGPDEQKCYTCAYTDLAIINKNGELESRTEVTKTKAKDGFLHPRLARATDGTFLISAKDLKNNSIGLLRIE